jgi:hypothetical protein
MIKQFNRFVFESFNDLLFEWVYFFMPWCFCDLFDEWFDSPAADDFPEQPGVQQSYVHSSANDLIMIKDSKLHLVFNLN